MSLWLVDFLPVVFLVLLVFIVKGKNGKKRSPGFFLPKNFLLIRSLMILKDKEIKVSFGLQGELYAGAIISYGSVDQNKIT